MAGYMDIEIPRNGDYFMGWKFKDRLTGEILDITNWTFAMQFKRADGSGPVLAAAIFSQKSGPEGTINVRVRGSDFTAVEGLNEIVNLSYDCLARDSENIITAQVRGLAKLTPGVSSYV